MELHNFSRVIRVTGSRRYASYRYGVPWLAALGGLILSWLNRYGHFTRFAFRGFVSLVRGAGPFHRSELLLPQLYRIGTQSIWVVVVLGFFVGSAIGLEAYSQFAMFGLQSRVGALVALTVVAQVGPVLAATMVAGRVGGRVSSELGTMQVTEQLDAMRMLGVDPIMYLVVPRVLACMTMLPVLTVFSDLLGVTGGYVVVVWGYQINAVDYFRAMADAVTSWDVLTGIGKSIVFGWLIGIISCYHGFHCERGARGVGRAVTTSFVATFVAIILTDLVLVRFFKNIYPMIFSTAHPTVFTG